MDGKLFSVLVTYGPEQLERLDEGKLLVEKMVDKLGPPQQGWPSNQQIPDVSSLDWEFSRQNRRFSLYRDYGFETGPAIRLLITDTKVFNEYEKRLAAYHRSGSTGID